MKDTSEWIAGVDVNEKPWLILGKGPSFRKIAGIDTANFSICTLNHVIREVPAKIAHVIDIDVVIDCAEAIDRNAEYLVLPYRPHENNKPGVKLIADFIHEIPVLEKLDREGRLVCYNFSSSEPVTSSPVVKAKFFSAEAALDFLAISGATTVRSLGVDGGSSYSKSFEDLSKKTRLNNGHKSFDKQFKGIARTIRETGVTYGPLHYEIPVRVFVGTDSAQMAGVKALEYSIKKHASVSVEVIPIDDRDVPVPKDPQNRSKTGFSFSRFLIPKICGYRGKAIYLDADMQVFSDIAELWNTPFEGADVVYSELEDQSGNRVPQNSVMLLNCEKLKWDVDDVVRGLDDGSWNYADIMHHLCIVPPSKKRAGLAFEWNSLEYYEEGKTCLIHYTDMPTQPWVSNKNLNGQLWYRLVREGLNDGFISKDFLCGEIEQGHVSPGLLKWLGLPNLPEYEKMRGDWIPPFRRIQRSEVGAHLSTNNDAHRSGVMRYSRRMKLANFLSRVKGVLVRIRVRLGRFKSSLKRVF